MNTKQNSMVYYYYYRHYNKFHIQYVPGKKYLVPYAKSVESPLNANSKQSYNIVFFVRNNIYHAVGNDLLSFYPLLSPCRLFSPPLFVRSHFLTIDQARGNVVFEGVIGMDSTGTG